MSKEIMMVKVLDLREMNGQYSYNDLQLYIDRVGIIQEIDEANEEALVRFYDYFNKNHSLVANKAWFPTNQLEPMTWDKF